MTLLASDPTTLQVVWYILIAVLWIGYLVLEGYDYGVAMLIPFLGKDEKEKRVMVNSIGPLWDGNEVWLLTAGGATFAAFPGWYATRDAGHFDADGFLSIMGRTDDIINVAGHRLSTGAMEEVLTSHPDVAECAVIGVADELKGQLPMGFLCISKGVDRAPEAIIKECVKLVRDQIGPVAAFKLALVVDRLPKTRSGKILRGTMAKIADGESFKMPATIDDPAILDELRAALQTIGYAKAPAAAK